MSYLDIPNFVSRSIMPPDDLAALGRVVWVRTLDSVAAAPSPERGIPNAVPSTGNASAVIFTPGTALTADDTNYATISVFKRTLGLSPVLIAQATTQTTSPPGLGDLVDSVGYAIPLVGGAPITQGDQLTVSVSKTGAGCLFPNGELAVYFNPSYLDQKLAYWESYINSRLVKRYKVPFDAPVPEIVLGWQERLVTRDCYLRRGFNLGSAQDEEILKRAKDAEAELKEAADSKDGLFELPLNEGTDPSVTAVSVAGPMAYTAQSPYVWADQQRRKGSWQDGQGRGSL